MARQLTTRYNDHTRSSMGNTTISDFDPDHEALVSTRQLDDSEPALPAQGNRIRKQAQSPPRNEPDYAINTSAIERAFPEFSEVDSSPSGGDDEDSDISIEVGRGPKKPMHRLDDSRNSFLSVENSVRSSSPAVNLEYPKVSNTPPKATQRTSSKKMTAAENLRRDAQIRHANQAQKENVDPRTSIRSKKAAPTLGPTNTINVPRRTLSEMHAKVRETYDGSYIADDRPQGLPLNTRTTRFGLNNRDVSAQVAAAVDNASREVPVRNSQRTRMETSSHQEQVNPTFTMNTLADNGTHQSFLLPDLPNLSELVSGVYEDGTPVFSRNSRARVTRFVPLSGLPAEASHNMGHLPLESVPVPEDEKAIFVSLKLLQSKVADLEMAKADAEQRLESLAGENAQLKKNEYRRQKEHYNHPQVSTEELSGRINEMEGAERKRFEAANLALQNRLDIAERKVQVHEVALKNLARERDSAISQLGVAYLSSQDLKSEVDELRAENTELKARLTKYSAISRHFLGKEDTEEDVASEPDKENESDHQKSTRKDTGANAVREDTHTRITTQIEREISKIDKRRQDEELFSLDLSQPLQSMSKHAEAKASSTAARKEPNTGKQRVKRVIVDDVDTTGPIDANYENIREHTKGEGPTASQDLTFLSLMDAREIAQLRKTLEEERAARKQRQALSTRDSANSGFHTRRLSGPSVTVPRKSSLKTMKASFPRPASEVGDATTTGRPALTADGQDTETDRRRHHSDDSITSKSRRRRSLAEMTSAFILPDITFRQLDLDKCPPARLSESAQKVLDEVARHDGRNCTVCKQLLDSDVPHDHGATNSRETVKIPKPVPVSDRMPEPSAYNEEPTIRPSQPPAIALATVLKSIEDELAHLKMQLATCQNAYTQHDASLSKRQRKSLYRKIEQLLKEIDVKSDQIYALYDVLEGQKQDGHEMTEVEVEVTLQSIGIDVKAAVAKGDDTRATVESVKNPMVLVEDTDEEDEELPWEGFESTADVTGRSVASRRV